MEPMTMMAIAGGISAFGSIIGGISAERTSRLNAFNTKTESIIARAQAIEQTNLRNEELQEALSVSNALFMGAYGRDDRSMEAFQKREKRVSAEDVSSIEMMSYLNQLKAKGEAAGIKRKGRESLFAGIIEGASTGLQTYASYTDVAPPTDPRATRPRTRPTRI